MGKKLPMVALGLLFLIAAALLAENESVPTVESLRKGRLHSWRAVEGTIFDQPETSVSASPGATYTVTNTADSGPGSLRQAILNANANPGFDVINFNIPGAGVQTIFPLTPLPWLTDPAGVKIDGLTQPGSAIGSNPPQTLNLKIELDGILCATAGPPHSVRGLVCQSDNDTIQGLIVNNWWNCGLSIQGGPTNEYARYCMIRWNIVGMDSSGTVCKGNGREQGTNLWSGICITNSPADDITPAYAFLNTIQENLSSCNYTEGITILGPIQPGDVYSNFVLGNWVGTDINGTADRGNIHEGICLAEGTHDNLVRGNMSSGNDYDGIGLQGYDNEPYAAPPIQTRRNTVDSNIVGLDINLNPLPNTFAGITLGEYGPTQWGCADSNFIGPGNIVAENGWDGVAVWEDDVNNFNADWNLITQNSIYDNDSLGIDLQNDYVTPNDPGDPDTGPNEEMNFPVITSAVYSGGNITVTGTLDNPTPNTATVEVFEARLDPSGYGEGETYLGSATPDGLGNWSLTVPSLVVIDSVTATATDQDNNTSEFSATVAVTTEPQYPRDHFKVWSVDTIPVDFFPQVMDQFHSEYFDIDVTRLDFFSNPVDKNDEGIQRPFDHLTWFKTSPYLIQREVEYQNQFESTTVSIDSLVYLLVPSKKDDLPPPDSLDHYLCYRIENPSTIIGEVKLEDQFGIEYIDSVRSKYFCAPCDKIHLEMEYKRFDSTTHYVAYEIFPEDYISVTVTDSNQFLQVPLTVTHSELLLVPTTKGAVSVVDTCEYYKPAYVDYAPAGMPDFDQKQDAWIDSATGAWSHCGPVALADCFWWFDSKFETSGTPPPTVADNYPLVQNYDMVTLLDDHDTSNVMRFVDSLALYCNTNPPGQSGTYLFDLANGAQNWLNKVGLGANYSIQVIPIDPAFGFEYIREQVLLSQDVILLLGFWQEVDGSDYCERVGGHYVTVAGVCPDLADSALCISDPYFDLNEGNPPGGPPHNADVHNDAQYVSGPHGTMHHDKYYVVPTPCNPSGQPWQVELANYAVNAGNIGNWVGQNQYDTNVVQVPPNNQPIHTLIEWAVVICPVEEVPEPTPGKVKHNTDGYNPADGDPTGTEWHELWPNFCDSWRLDSWIDNGDGYLSYCDTIDFVNLLDGRKIWEHVELVTPTITVTTLDDPPDTIYLDELDPNPMCTTLTNPVGTYWHEVYPTYGTIWQITNWNDNGNGYLDSCDVITIEIPGGISPQDVHVEAVETDIVTTPLPTPGDEYDHNIDGYIPSMGSPVGTWWHELWPSYCTQYYLDDWHDNGDSILSYCDTIRFSGLIPEDTVWKHIEEVTGTIKVSAPQEPETLYFDFMCGNPNVDPITDPFNTYWHQIWPVFSIRHVCVGWTDNGNLVLDSCDWIDLMAIDGPDSGVVTSYHVEAWETDIITTIVQLGPPEDTCEYYKNQYGDYAPFSVPDFDQKQDGWTGPPLGGWSHCGPVALADCFWWIDSRFEDPTSPPPPTISDSYPLVQNYTGTFVDDHDTMNVIPFVDSLAIYCNTNGSPPPYPGGTWIMDLYNGAVQWISNRGLDTVSNWLKVDLIPSPDFETIQDEVLKSEDVILLLGFYEQHGPDIYCRLGGHYVTAAGVCTTETRICISDPWYDENEGEPPAGSAHGSSIHNDAQFISGPHGQIHHDAYFSPNNPLPDPTHPQPPIVELTDYPDYWPDIANFMEMNQTEPQMPYCQWQGGPILTMVEYAVVVSPCCVGIRGDVDGSGTINVADVTYLVAYLKGMGPAPPCFEEADADGSGSINVADVTYLVAYLKGLGPAPPSCP